MSHRRNDTTDELPELQSDADVDALMARIRAKVAPPASTPPESGGPAVSDDPIRDLIAAQDEFAAGVVRAMHAMVDVFEDIEADARDTAPRARTRRRAGKQRPPAPRKNARRTAR